MNGDAADRVRYARDPFYQRVVPAELIPPEPPDPATFHRALPGYAPTPLVPLPALASELRVKEVWVSTPKGRPTR